MRNKFLLVAIITVSVICFSDYINADLNYITGIEPSEIVSSSKGDNCSDDDIITSRPTVYYVRRVTGNLRVENTASVDTFTAYFHVPISFREQAPILVNISSPNLVDYRFLHITPTNLTVAARMINEPSTTIDWEAYMYIMGNSYNDMPETASFPAIDDLPDSVLKWLSPTDCVQSNDHFIQNIALTIRDSSDDLIELADNITDYCDAIPWTFEHYPMAFDAYYALNWGNSCTGHAHAAAALFRANGVPARVLTNIPHFGSTPFDMHWFVDYYIPEYGWVSIESSTGHHPIAPQYATIMMACYPQDEFPVYLPCGIEGYWHSSDPALGMFTPHWGGAHNGYDVYANSDSTHLIEYAHMLTDSVYYYHTNYWGITHSPENEARLNQALLYQQEAYNQLSGYNHSGYIEQMELALNEYRQVVVHPVSTIFSDDFESGVNGWAHGGILDEWELGQPSAGPNRAYSGVNCWGTDLDGNYEDAAYNWLLSPQVDLSDKSCAYVSFWIYNWVQDLNQGFVYDPIWLEISTDSGQTFTPLCSYMGGVNDDPDIPDVGGWTKMVLDLTEYIGSSVNIKFSFSSDGSDNQYGCYIDDFHVYGRDLVQTGIISDDNVPIKVRLSQCYPNPFNAQTKINYTLPQPGHVTIDIYDVLGRKVDTPVDCYQAAGKRSVVWDAKRFASGVYFYRLTTGDTQVAGEMTLLK